MLEVALIGVGRMGLTLGQVVAGSVDSVSITAIADPDSAAARQAAPLVGEAVKIYQDTTAALEHPGLRAVLVATPTPTHADIVEEALVRGLHVFCEKPLSFEPEASDRLGIYARDAGLILQVGFFRRYSTPWVTARKLLAEGAVGEPVFIRSSTWDQDLPVPAFADPAVSGGLIVDDGIHEFDVVEWLTGRPIERVACVVAPVAHPELRLAGDIDCAAILLELEGGVPAVIDLSRNARYADDMRTEILAPDGAIFIDTVPNGHTRVGTRRGRDVIDESLVTDGFLDGVARQLAAFATTVDDRTQQFPDAFASSRAMRAAIAANQAGATGRWVSVQEVAAFQPPTALFN